MASVEGLKSAADTSKQIITLATGVAALSITFWDKFHGPHTPTAAAVFIGLSWIAFVFAIVFALWVLLAITGTLTALDRKADSLELNEDQKHAADAYGGNIALPAVAMIVMFAGGLAFCVAAAIINSIFTA